MSVGVWVSHRWGVVDGGQVKRRVERNQLVGDGGMQDIFSERVEDAEMEENGNRNVAGEDHQQLRVGDKEDWLLEGRDEGDWELCGVLENHGRPSDPAGGIEELHFP